MTGLECLYEEMKKRGCTDAQCKSKAVAVVLDIIANDGKQTYIDLYDAERRLQKAIDLTRREEGYKEDAEKEYREIRAKSRAEEERIEEKYDEVCAYVDAFNESLKSVDTPEGRDALRAAQLFINSVKIDTKYDNTAFIVGLSAILSNNKISAVDELKKINKDLFNHMNPWRL